MKIVSVEKKLVDKLFEECTETNNGVKLAKRILAKNENKHKCSSCTHCTFMLFSIVFAINVGIVTYFAYYKYMNRKKETDCKEKFYFLGNNY